jgi:hypothetical protein
MEVLEQHHDLEQVRALLGHARIDTNPNEIQRVAPKGFEPVFGHGHVFTLLSNNFASAGRRRRLVLKHAEKRHQQTKGESGDVLEAPQPCSCIVGGGCNRED